MGVTTYGTLRRTADGGWSLDAAPHVMMRVRRIFPRVQSTRRAAVLLKDTPEVALDLEWLLTRWPLDVDHDAAAHLTGRADAQRARQSAVVEILGGRQMALGGDVLELARPARPYQQQAADIVHATDELLLVDDVGLGKTMTSLLVMQRRVALPALVVTLTHLPQQWLSELAKTLPLLQGHVLRNGAVYDPFDGADLLTLSPDVIVTSYSKLAKWRDTLAGRVRTVVFDEVQELRRRDSDKYRAAAHIASQATYRMGLTATPIYNYADEIHTIFDIVAPDVLGSRDEFLREWSGHAVGFGNNAMVKDAGPLGTYLRDQGVMLRRTRADVGREIPEPVKIEQPVDTDHEHIERAMSDVAVLANLVLDTQADNADRFRASGELDWKLRQLTGVAKAPYVAAFVRFLLESEQRVVLYGWHRDVYDIWLRMLGPFGPRLYTGSESVPAKQRAVVDFLDDAHPCRVLIVSLRSGAGLDGLQQGASVCVFGELDWSPGIHEQCIGRLWRDGQESTVVAYYMVSDDGTDPLMIDALGVKQSQADAIRDPDKPLVGRTADADRLRQLAHTVLDRARAGAR